MLPARVTPARAAAKETIFKPDEFENVGFSFKCGRKSRKTLIREVKHDVYGKRQTALKNETFAVRLRLSVQ